MLLYNISGTVEVNLLIIACNVIENSVYEVEKINLISINLWLIHF